MLKDTWQLDQPLRDDVVCVCSQLDALIMPAEYAGCALPSLRRNLEAKHCPCAVQALTENPQLLDILVRRAGGGGNSDDADADGDGPADINCRVA